MRQLPQGLSDQLASGLTTLCHCWRLRRRDGVVMGFTDHDRDLVFDGTTFRAASGMSASEWVQSSGLAVDTIDAQGALSSAALTEEDLALGRWDDAAVEIWRVDWSDVANRVRIFAGSSGEVARGRSTFRTELRGLAHYLNQEVGRVYGRPCDAVLGDARCKIDLDAPAFRGSGSVMGHVNRRVLTAAGLDGFAAAWFSGGRLTWSTGANAGTATEVIAHAKGGTVTLTLSEKAPREVAEGDAFVVRAGCDKALATCRDRFGNVANHRGFPHMPGNDFAFSYAVTGSGGHDGGSFFR